MQSEFKTNRFHQFQRDNQRKLSAYIKKQNTLQTQVSTPEDTRDSYRHSKVTHNFRRRAQEKAHLQANNKPIYDYNPEEFESDQDLFESINGGGLVDGGVGGREEEEGAHRLAMTSRQISVHLRHISTLRTSTSSALRSTRSTRKTEVRQTLLDMFQKQNEARSGSGETTGDGCDVVMDKRNEFVRGNERERRLIKPNGPISKDILWRQRVLGSGSGGRLKSTVVGILSTSLEQVARNEEKKKKMTLTLLPEQLNGSIPE